MKKVMGVLLLMLLMTGSVFAQQTFTDEELQHIEFLATAYDNLLTLKTYHAESKQEIAQNITSGFTEINQTIQQELSMDVAVNPSGDASNMYTKTSQLISTEVGGQPQELENTTEMVIFEGEVYMRFSQDFPGFPQGWVKAEDVPGMEMLNMDEYADLTGRNSLALYPINEDTVLSIEELEGETVDGKKMRVFDVVFDPQALAESGAGQNLFDPSTLGLTPEEYWARFSEGTTQQQRIWIGVDDHLIYKVDMVMESDVDLSNTQIGSMNIVQTITSTSLFSAFNEPVEIEEPVIGE